MAHVSHRLKGSFEGALAGGGDPATSPLYVFGPFLRLLAVSGAGAVSFGAPIWMVVGTVLVVSLMYRHVMQWIPDGSGGSGLCEEEFGSWAVKVNASITVIEYTLTFLVSIAALVTFVADRVEGLGRIERTALALTLSVLVGVVVNRGPRLAARVFGPATAAVLLLLWVLVGAVLLQRGIDLPPLRSAAFSAEHVHTTLGGYVRLLALMTGIEVFANLVAAYEGAPAARANKAFGSLLIVMVSTLVTMIVVGPAIYELADAHNDKVSVFTQTMDALLPAPLAYAGTLVGIVVLLSAAAASAQGIQNLALGLRQRHYVPAAFGQRNRFDVADRPVVIQVVIVGGCFVAFGTHEETYLALYAAGVFVLLGLTGWASVKRLARPPAGQRTSIVSLVGTVLAALVTSGAAALIFEERFSEGAWTYLLLVPVLYAIFSRYRARLGAPGKPEEQLGRMLAEKKTFLPVHPPEWPCAVASVIDGSTLAETALVAGAAACVTFACPLSLLSVGEPAAPGYLESMQQAFPAIGSARLVPSISRVATEVSALGADLVVVAREADAIAAYARELEMPVLFVHGAAGPSHRYPRFSRVVLGLDGSLEAEATLPFAARFLMLGAELRILLVPDGGTSEQSLRAYGVRIADTLRASGTVDVVVGGSGPARTIQEQADEFGADIVVVARRGGGGVNRAAVVPLGSVPARLLDKLGCSLLVVPVTNAPEPIGRTPVAADQARS